MSDIIRLPIIRCGGKELVKMDHIMEKIMPT